MTDVSVVSGSNKKNEREKISLKNFPVNDPGIHGAGLVFNYEKYHLTPGIAGCPVILLPYDEIRDCLKEPFNHYHSNLDEFEKYQTIDTFANSAYWYTETKLDSIRTAWGPADDGKPWPRDIFDWYKYRGHKIKKHYKLDDIIGTWVGYGHLYDPRQVLTINSNGRFSNISEEALGKDSLDCMIYNYTSTTQGVYNYDSNKNLLMLTNWEDIIKLKNKNPEAFVKRRDPQNKYLIIHSIDNDTMYVADEIGDLWPFFRKR